MQTGVVRRKCCKNHYRCEDCSFERAMRRAAKMNRELRQAGQAPEGKRRRITAWEEKARALPFSRMPCIHHLKKRIHFKSCTNDYRCGDCEFDQYFYDEYTVHAVVKPVDVLEVKGFRLPQGYYLHLGHAWAKIEEGSSVKVGIDDFAFRLLGPLDRVEAPLVGKEVRQGQPDITLARGNNHAKLLSPVSGVVTAINPKLREKGDLANQDPYSEGWVMRVHPGNLRKDLKNLMINQETVGFLGGEVEQLYQVIEESAGFLAADGGDLGKDIYGNMPQLGWERLAKLFLRT